MASTSYPNQITVRVSDDEKREIERRAAAADLSVSRYLAKRGTEEAAIRPAEDREEEAEALRELRREIASIGGNINQIAKHANRRGDLDAGAVRSAAKAAEQAADAVLDQIQALYQR